MAVSDMLFDCADAIDAWLREFPDMYPAEDQELIRLLVNGMRTAGRHVARSPTEAADEHTPRVLKEVRAVAARVQRAATPLEALEVIAERPETFAKLDKVIAIVGPDFPITGGKLTPDQIRRLAALNDQ